MGLAIRSAKLYPNRMATSWVAPPGSQLALALYPFFRNPLAPYMAAVFALTLPHALVMEAWLRRPPPLAR